MVAAPEVLEGTWDEIAQQADRLAGRRLRVVVLPDKEPQVSEPPNPTLLLLDQLDTEDETATEEAIVLGKEQWESFRNGINENRRIAGSRIVFP